MNQYPHHHPSRAGKIFAGLILLAVGTIMLLQRLGYLFPHWLLTWEVLVICIGLFIGFRSNFRHPAWFVLIAVGIIFLIENFYPGFHARRFIWPILIMLIGFWMIFGRQMPKRRKFRLEITDPEAGPGTTAPGPLPASPFAASPAPAHSPVAGEKTGSPVSHLDFLQVTSVFGGVKKIVVSKNFQGGEIMTFMGGSEINLTQADIQGQAVLDVSQVMGGTKLIVPANWTVVSEMAAIFGGFDDKRMLLSQTVPDKVLLIKGTSIMGGIEVLSF